MTNIEQLVEELIAQRTYTRARVAVHRKRKRSRYTYGKGGKRQLTVAEVIELQDCVSAARKTRCRPTNQCWEPNCERCGPA